MCVRVCGWVLSSLLLTGCGTSLFTERGTNPVLLDRFGEHRDQPDYGVIATGAEKRLVIVRYDTRNRPEVACAEPPPDAIAAVAGAFGAAARGAAEAPAAGQAGATLAGEFNRAFSNSTAGMLYRSQGLQLIRDMQFTLCMSLMNSPERNDGVHAQRREEYLRNLMTVVDKGVHLIRAEMDAIKAAASRPGPSVNAPTINLPNVSRVDAVVAPTKP